MADDAGSTGDPTVAGRGGGGLGKPEVRIPFLYALFAGAWIALSDRLLELVASSRAQQTAWSIGKGLGFVAATTLLLYFGVRQAFRRERAAFRQLADRDAQLRALAEAVPDPIFVKDRESRWLFANQAALEVLGKKATEILGHTDLEIYREPKVAQAIMASDRRVIESGQREVLEERVETPAGMRLFLSAKAPHRDADGKVVGVIGSARDITGRKEDEARLAAERERLAVTLRSIGDAVVSTDERGRVAVLNAAAEQLTGFSAGEAAGRPLAEVLVVVDERTRERVPDAVEVLLRGEGKGGVVHHALLLSRGGGEHPVSQNADPIRDPAGCICGVVLVVRDQTAERRAARALSESEERFRALIEKATDILVVLDAEARIRFWSPGATEALGFEPEEVLGRSAYDFIHPDDVVATREVLEHLRVTPGAVARVHRRQLHRDGSWRLVELVDRSLLHDPAVRGIVANMRDVTTQRRLEDQFHQSQKLESVGRLAGGVAHDFNNLLTVILSGVDGLREDLRSGRPPRLDEVEEIYTAGRRASDLTRQLLAFARKEAIAPVVVDLNAALCGTEKLLRRVLGEDVELLVEPRPGLWPILCDPGQVEQVILNLSVNARHAMPTGGKLTLSARNVPAEALPDGPGRGGEWVALSVRDTGVGMTAEVKAHLFEPFFTTKEPGKGTGLGLATVYGILRQSGGQVEVESAPGKGSCFELFFPRHMGSVKASAVAARPESPGGSETVLVIEDDPLVRAVTVRTLRGAGYRVLVASGGAEALTMLEQSDVPHLVVTDVILPGQNGRVVVDELRRRHGGLRVLFVSGYTADVIEHHGVKAAGAGFLSKPFTPSSLLRGVRAALDARVTGLDPGRDGGSP